MEWKPNRADKTPVYKQIADYIERGISSGEFPSIASYLLSVC